jgi:hypothetical protein
MAEHEDTDLRTAAKAAAATAAVGAAVGVARAIAARAEEASHRDDHNEDEIDEREAEEPPIEAVSDTADDDEDDDDDMDEPESEAVQGTSVDRLRRLTESARELLQELSGAEVESVSAVDRTRDGWRVTLETVEVRRVPDSMDVMATYNVELDGDGDLVRYERGRRYARAQSDHGDHA